MLRCAPPIAAFLAENIGGALGQVDPLTVHRVMVDVIGSCGAAHASGLKTVGIRHLDGATETYGRRSVKRFNQAILDGECPIGLVMGFARGPDIDRPRQTPHQPVP